MSSADSPRPARAITTGEFLADRHGKTFLDVLEDPAAPFDEVLAFFNDAFRQQRMEDAEIHHDRAPLAGVVRELEADSAIGGYFASVDRRRSTRLRQAIGVLVRLIMERRGWQTTGKKGSLGVRGPAGDSASPDHNTGGLALWFLRAERYRRSGGMPFRSTRDRCRELERVEAETPDTPVVSASTKRSPSPPPETPSEP
ncbi:hypothetical protein Poly30_17520 [Planctomycetes bacterium Poly30]|uniref:Uncharacterized protein n=1 Tax=Saltatorellus ferox TaxID=2528018 RepID=A0A518EQA5_9BACT|nr:hypothetical protein Poly30_17520 [Planctomycetes bacterium Poly30]